MILALVAVIFQLLYVITFAYTFGVKTTDVQIMLNSGIFQSMHQTMESKMVFAVASLRIKMCIVFPLIIFNIHLVFRPDLNPSFQQLYHFS